MNMTKETALELVQNQIDLCPSLQYAEVNPDFDKWHRDTRVVLQRVFGAKSAQVTEFEAISFQSGIITRDLARRFQLDSERFARGMKRAGAFLQSIISEIRQFWDDSEVRPVVPADPLTVVLRLCGRFHQIARQFRSRRDNRSTIEIEDEFDVQDLLHALLRVDFDDIRPEEWTPSYAGKSARMDFLLKDHQLVIEAKKTRKGLGEKEVGDELLVDIARYKSHPDCKTLVCFLYDPEGRIGNPRGMERDLSGERDGLKVVAVVNPGG